MTLTETYITDKIRAFDARFEALKIAFSPLTFQAVRALLELGILRTISDCGEAGITAEELAERTAVSEYGVRVLTEIALSMNICKWTDAQGERLTLGKTGFFLLEDRMTRVNFDFVNDVCYHGAFNLTDSIKNGKPEGLKHFGEQWTTIYEALATLPEQAKRSWFAFDHFYSDIAFPEALPIVFEKAPRRLFDIGGNTAKWAISCCRYNPDVAVTIIDLPGQTAVAQENAKTSGFADRISTFSGNILDKAMQFPQGADAVWMSQFLDCFSLRQITKIFNKIAPAVTPQTDVYVLEPLWNRQKILPEAYALQCTSLYFTCMANGNSKMYRSGELKAAVEAAGFELKEAHHNLGANAYSLLNFHKKA